MMLQYQRSLMVMLAQYQVAVTYTTGACWACYHVYVMQPNRYLSAGKQLMRCYEDPNNPFVCVTCLYAATYQS
jgi:hypothetical protein